MKLVISIMSALAILLIQPSDVSGDYWYGDFSDNRTLVFSEDAVMYDAPDLASPVTALIPMGTDIRVSGSAGEDIFQAACLLTGTMSHVY